MESLLRSTASRRLVRSAVLLVALLVLLSAALSVGSTVAERRWDARCLSRSGYIVAVAAPDNNPLIVETTDPTYQCISPSGVVLSRR